MKAAADLVLSRRIFFQVLATAGRSRDRIPLGANISAVVQTGPGVQPASETVGTRFLYRE